MSIPGHKVMNLGASGSGKTFSIPTIIKAGITPFVIFTEKGGSALRKAMVEQNIPVDKIHTATVSPVDEGWGSLIEMSKNINTLSFEGITKISDPNRTKYQQFIQFLMMCNNFVDERTGESFGDVGSWNTDRALFCDTLSGLNDMSMNLVVGIRPTRSQADWMVAQNNLLAALKKLMNLQCHFILNAHLEREQDEVSGGIKLMASTLGKKLAPKLPKDFDEVLVSERRTDKWFWSTIAMNTDTKARLLPLSDTIPQDYAGLIDLWKASGGVIEPTEQPAAA